MELKTKNIGGITVIELAGRMTVDNIYSLTKSIERNVFPFTGKIEDSAGKSSSRVILDMEGLRQLTAQASAQYCSLPKNARRLAVI